MKIWRIQNYLINRGLNIEAANDLIIDVYGTDKVTSLAIAIQHYQKDPSHPFIGSQRFHPRLVRGNANAVSP